MRYLLEPAGFIWVSLSEWGLTNLTTYQGYSRDIGFHNFPSFVVMLLSKLQCGTFVFPLQGVPCIICLKQGNCISITDNTILTFEGGLQKQLISAFTIGFRLDISYTGN
ncbi:hypothetical protein AAZV13_18G084900 [Glycine max]